MAENYIFSKETDNLIMTYFDAFSNLYGTIPMNRALRIIRRQNSELDINDDRFSEFVNNADLSKKHYIITTEPVLCEESDDPGEPLDRILVAQHLYILDYEDYFKLADEQCDRPFYVPDKEELLKYADELYFEKTKYFNEFNEFLKSICPFADDDTALDFQLSLRIDDNDFNYAQHKLRFLTGNQFKDFKNKEEARKFALLYTKLRNNTRKHTHRGHTPSELGDSYSVDIAPKASPKKPDSQNLRTEKQPKPSLNGPCPCGSGKKFKRCCGKTV